MLVGNVRSLATVVAVVALSAAGSCARAQPPAGLDTRGSWFKPLLEVDDDPALCADVLAVATREFFAEKAVDSNVGPADFSPHLEAVDVESFAVGPPVKEPARRVPDWSVEHVVTIEGKSVYLARTYQGGCGGACDAHIYYAATHALAGMSSDPRNAGALSLAVPEYAYSWLKAADGRYFIGFRGDFRDLRETRYLFRLTADGSWRETCRETSTPPPLDQTNNERVREVLSTIHALDAAALVVAGDEGEACGTLHALARVNTYRAYGLERALYRPWALLGAEEGARTAGEANLAKLELWAANGLFERDALRRYLGQRDITISALTKFYVAQFGWPESDAASSARTVVFRADADFVFPSDGDPYAWTADTRELRQAILEHRPLAAIRALDAPLAAIDGENDWHAESVLNVAVEYPEALRYLLDRGANVNKPNAFGKTPLMYAAQRNAYEGAEILLTHGADPNARTHAMPSECYYALSRSSMTALHYAVRYASKRVVELLLAKGAAPYVVVKAEATVGTGTNPVGYPVQWLKHYNSAESMERNPNIAAAEVPGLEASLTPPDSAGLADLARQLRARAEGEYAAGNVPAAHAALRLALDASPDSQRALGDMALVALRAGYPNEAAEAAQRLVDQSTDRRTLANAWFNLGLACDPAVRRDDLPPCSSSPVYPYLQSWSIEPTPQRAAKIADVMQRAASCEDTRPNGTMARYLLWPASGRYGGGSREGGAQVYKIYVYHRAGIEMRADSFRWPAAPAAKISVVRRYDLGDFAVTALESDDMATALSVGDFTCVAR